jgi:hypothetical protein
MEKHVTFLKEIVLYKTSSKLTEETPCHDELRLAEMHGKSSRIHQI